MSLCPVGLDIEIPTLVELCLFWGLTESVFFRRGHSFFGLIKHKTNLVKSQWMARGRKKVI